MTIHAIILSFIVATLLGATYHLLRGGSLRRLGLYIFAANISFFLGHGFSELVHWQLVQLGSINLFPAILATILGLLLTTALAGQEPVKERTPSKRRKRSK